jgi:hypothetical protein
MIQPGEAHELLGRWWWHYDAGDFDVLPALLAGDVHFTCRTDTGATVYEDFVRADVRGRDDVAAWQTEHRRQSPHPLRHNATNVHVTAQREGEADYASYLFVTHIVDGAVANLSTGLVTGTVREEDGALRIAALHVVLDTQDSVVFATRATTG